MGSMTTVGTSNRCPLRLPLAPPPPPPLLPVTSLLVAPPPHHQPSGNSYSVCTQRRRWLTAWWLP